MARRVEPLVVRLPHAAMARLVDAHTSMAVLLVMLLSEPCHNAIGLRVYVVLTERL